jgi:hypothetical protein
LIGLVLAAAQVIWTKGQEKIMEWAVMISRLTNRVEHLVIRAVQFVVTKGFFVSVVRNFGFRNHVGEAGLSLE